MSHSLPASVELKKTDYNFGVWRSRLCTESAKHTSLFAEDNQVPECLVEMEEFLGVYETLYPVPDGWREKSKALPHSSRLVVDRAQWEAEKAKVALTKAS